MAICSRCDMPFERSVGRGRPRKYCSDECRRPRRPVAVEERLCKFCAQRFMGRVDKMYCSSLCANREHFYQKLYGIGGLEFRNLLEQQGGVCALCRQDMGTGRGRHIDHDHLTGKVRGILCKSCNTALGAFGDDPGRLRRAARYIEQGGVHASEIAIRMRAFEVQQRSRDANR